MFAATYDKILEECKCVPYFHTIAYSDYPVICAGEGLYCMNNVLRDIGSHTEITNYEAPEESQATNRTDDEGKINHCVWIDFLYFPLEIDYSCTSTFFFEIFLNQRI